MGNELRDRKSCNDGNWLWIKIRDEMNKCEDNRGDAVIYVSVSVSICGGRLVPRSHTIL